MNALNPDFLKGYRTYLVGAFLFLYAIAGMAGVEVPKAPEAGGGEALIALIMLLMRKVTTSPPAPVIPGKNA